MARRRNCGRCHECGLTLRKVLDGEEWCPTCQKYRRYPSHGWYRGPGADKDEECPAEHILDRTAFLQPDLGRMRAIYEQMQKEREGSGD